MIFSRQETAFRCCCILKYDVAFFRKYAMCLNEHLAGSSATVDIFVAHKRELSVCLLFFKI